MTDTLRQGMRRVAEATTDEEAKSALLMGAEAIDWLVSEYEQKKWEEEKLYGLVASLPSTLDHAVNVRLMERNDQIKAHDKRIGHDRFIIADKLETL